MSLVLLICFDEHDGRIAGCGAPHPMRHAQGFPLPHWTPSSGEYLRRITLAAAMVIDVIVPANGLQNTTFSLPLT
jgi:hypothetical protein